MSDLVDLCNINGISLHFKDYENTALGSSHSDFYDYEDYLVHEMTILESTLAFGQWKVVELERGNDVEGMKEMLERCDFWKGDKSLAGESLPCLRSKVDAALAFGRRKLVELESEEDEKGMRMMFKDCTWLRAGMTELKG